MSRPSGSKSNPTDDSAPRLIRRIFNVTGAQDRTLTTESKSLGIGKNELLRRVLDEWLTRLPKRG